MLYFGMFPIGAQIYLKRLEKNLTQTELAARADIPQSNLSNIEKGKQDLTVSTLRRIAVALDVRPAEFFSESDDQKGKNELTRDQIEKIAKTVAQGTKKGNEITASLKQMVPRQGRIRVKDLNRSWLGLRSKFSVQEINSIYERIQEHKRRT